MIEVNKPVVKAPFVDGPVVSQASAPAGDATPGTVPSPESAPILLSQVPQPVSAPVKSAAAAPPGEKK